MGVFEFVIVIVFFSFVFKVVKLHYESQGNNSSNGTAEGPANALGNNAELNRGRRGDAVKHSAQVTSTKSGPAKLLWRFLFPAACCLAGVFFFYWSSGTVVYEPPSNELSGIQRHHEAPAALTPEAVPEVPEGVPAELAPTPPKAHSNAASEMSNPQKMTPREKDPDGFVADLYPSIADCGGPMAVKIYNEISGKIAGASGEKALGNGELEDPSVDADTGFNQFYLVNEELSDSDYIPFLIAFRKQMQSKLKECLVKDFTEEKSQDLLPPPRQFLVVVGRLQNKDGGKAKLSSGTLVCKLQGGELAAEFLINFIEKEWVNDFDAFAAQHPDGTFTVGHGEEFLPDESQAMKIALDSVGAKGNWETDKRLWIGNRAYDLTDSFRQKYERPYGDVFRYSVLLEPAEGVGLMLLNPDGPPKTEIVGDTLLASVFNCGWKPSFEWSVALLIGLTVVIGTISNVLTRGYYRTEISSSVVVMVVLGFCLLIAIIFSTIG